MRFSLFCWLFFLLQYNSIIFRRKRRRIDFLSVFCGFFLLLVARLFDNLPNGSQFASRVRLHDDDFANVVRRAFPARQGFSLPSLDRDAVSVSVFGHGCPRVRASENGEGGKHKPTASTAKKQPFNHN
ncbi:MAG: hypothetical protein J6Y87_07060 [Muribaculaceae bacterium]|nr:hypothetical protein [Muribaculaceae bacterium]